MPAASEAIRAKGTKIYLSIASAWTQIADVTKITAPPYSREEIDITHLDSPDNLKEKLGGLGDNGDCTFEIQYLPTSTTHKLLLALRGQQTNSDWKIEWSQGSPWTFVGWLKGFAPGEATAEGKLTAQVTICVTGVVTTPS